MVGDEEYIAIPREVLETFEKYLSLQDAFDQFLAWKNEVESRQEFPNCDMPFNVTAEDRILMLQEPTPIAYFRKRTGKTQSSLAKASGIAQSYLAQLESGRRTGTTETWFSIGVALGMPPLALVAEMQNFAVERRKTALTEQWLKQFAEPPLPKDEVKEEKEPEK
jgi:transcriptional regulator with XRE-family HTH domain